MKPIEERFTNEDLLNLKLKAVDGNEWVIVKLDIENDCSLKEFTEMKKLIFKRGRAFYEFKHEVESISKDQRLILYDIVSYIFNCTRLCISNLCTLKYSRRQKNTFIQMLSLRNCVRKT